MKVAVCEGCGKTFSRSTSQKKYCTRACYQRAWKLKHPGYASAAVKRSLARDPAKQERRREYMREYNQRPDVIARRNELANAKYQAAPEGKRQRSSNHWRGIQRFLTAVRTTCGCVDCGRTEGNLHFDHRPGTVKKFSPSSSRSLRRIIPEIEKCDVRCASCHAKRHEVVRRQERAAAA